MDIDLVLIGKIVGTHGIKGDVKVVSFSHFESQRFKAGKELMIFDQNNSYVTTLTINQKKETDKMLLLNFIDHLDINLVTKFINHEIRVNEPIKALPKDTYLYKDLIGCKVFHDSKLIGEVKEIMDIGIQQNLVIINENNKRVLYPFIKQFLKDVDIKNKIIHLDPIGGMINED